MAEWSMRLLQGGACEESILIQAKIHTDARSLRTPKMAVEAMCFAHVSACAFNHGGTIV